MDIQSKEDLDAQIIFNKLNQINKIENKLRNINFIPLYFFALLTLSYFSFNWSANPSNAIPMICVAIYVIGQSNVHRTNLLKKLFELKYGK